MVRKMAYVGLSYIAGLFFASFFITIINIAVVIGIIAISLLYFFMFKKCRKEILLISICFSIAVSSYVIYTKAVYEKILSYQNKSIEITGVIEDIKIYEGNKASYQIKGKINDKTKTTVIVYTNAVDGNLYDSVNVTGSFIKPEDTLSFPAESYYKSKNIFLQSDEVKSFVVSQNDSNFIRKKINQYREYIYNRITTILPEDEGAFIGAMLCGDTDYLSEARQKNLFRSGIGHIISVSGSHLMILAGLLLLVLNKLCINKWLRFGTIQVIIITYTAFTGMPVSVIRAGIMFTLLMLGSVMKRRADCLTSIALAGMLLTIADPFAIRDSSLLLSLAGTFGVTVFAPYVIRSFDFKGKTKGLSNALITMICASIVTFPFVVMSFDEVSIISPIANLILAPLCSLALICAILIALTGGVLIIANPLLLIAGLAVKLMFFISDFFVKIPYSYLPLGKNLIVILILIAIAGIAFISLRYKTPKALLSSVFVSIAAIIISVSIINLSESNNFIVTLLTEKNSSCLVLNKNGQTFIIDICGNGKISAVASKYLRKNGIKSVDMLLLQDNEQKSMSSYYNNLSQDIKYINMKDQQPIILPDKTVVKNINVGETINASGYKVYVYEKSYLIDFKDFRMLVTTSDDNKQYENVDIKLSIEDKNISLSQDNKSLNVDTKHSNAILIKAKKDGNYSIRRMNNALRE